MQWRRDLWIAVVAIGTGAFVVGERVLAASDEPGLVALVLVIGVSTAPMAFYAACRGRDVRFTLPTWVVVASVCCAAILGSAMSGLLGYSALVGLGPVATVAVALIEESVTLLVPLAVLFALPTRRAGDGLLVGAAAGAGFAVAETVGYLVTAPDVVGASAHAVLLRGLLGSSAQLAWSGTAAAALWLAAQEHWKARAVRRLVLVTSGMVGLHALWESADGVVARVALTVLNGMLLGWVLIRTTSRRGVPARVLARSSTPGSARVDGAAPVVTSAAGVASATGVNSAAGVASEAEAEARERAAEAARPADANIPGPTTGA